MFDKNLSTIKCKFPDLRDELLELEKADQQEIKLNFEKIRKINAETVKKQKYDLINGHAQRRAQRMIHVLKIIKTPTAENIGLDGSKALALLALHSNLPVMEHVLKIFKHHFKKNKSEIYYQAIPPLTDRIMILKNRQQLYGTNWTVDKTGKPFLVPVKDFHSMNLRRAKYGLGPAMKPVNLAFGAKKYPLGKGLAMVDDQKPMTYDEFKNYSEAYILKKSGHPKG